MKHACEKIEPEISDLHGYLTSKPAEFKLDDLDVLLHTECLVKHLGGQSEINPSAEDNDSSVGTFVMFILRDALEQVGLMPEKKVVPHCELKLRNHKRQLFLKQLEQVNDALD